MEQTKKSSSSAKSKQSSEKAKTGKKKADSPEKSSSSDNSSSHSLEKAPEPRLKKRYLDNVRVELIKTLSLKNVMEAPNLSKITINVGLGEAVANPKLLDSTIK